MNTITRHYIDGTFVESHGREVMDIINPTNRETIAQVTLADEEDTWRAIAAAKRAFGTFGRRMKEERAKILRRLHEVVSARIDDLTAVMVEEYGSTARFSRLIIEAGELSAMQTQACKDSGVGREFGTFGIEAFLEPKAILERCL